MRLAVYSSMKTAWWYSSTAGCSVVVSKPLAEHGAETAAYYCLLVRGGQRIGGDRQDGAMQVDSLNRCLSALPKKLTR